MKTKVALVGKFRVTYNQTNLNVHIPAELRAQALPAILRALEEAWKTLEKDSRTPREKFEHAHTRQQLLVAAKEANLKVPAPDAPYLTLWEYIRDGLTGF